MLLITVKVLLPAFSYRSTTKVSAVADQNGENDGEKKAENNGALVKEKEIAGTSVVNAKHLRYYTSIVHITEYRNNYQSSYYSKVTAPPPDLSI
ncbi:hypothetical protein [Mucilaginibacter sp.]|uniref:hypothetical protein n=1 Tax=Mucilaginibacter sp. TaxID=1882438 RepID=UPI0035BC63D6